MSSPIWPLGNALAVETLEKQWGNNGYSTGPGVVDPSMGAWTSDGAGLYYAEYTLGVSAPPATSLLFYNGASDRLPMEGYLNPNYGARFEITGAGTKVRCTVDQGLHTAANFGVAQVQVIRGFRLVQSGLENISAGPDSGSKYALRTITIPVALKSMEKAFLSIPHIGPIRAQDGSGDSARGFSARIKSTTEIEVAFNFNDSGGVAFDLSWFVGEVS